MSKRTKTSYAAYAAWNVEVEEITLNRQSEKGWQLKKGGCFHTIYKADDTVRYIYKIDYNPDARSESEEKSRYIEMYAQQGWEFINCTYNGWNYFRKTYNGDLPIREYEIYTDSDSYGSMMKRWVKLGRVLQLIELVVGIQNLIIGITADSDSNIFMSFIMFLIIVWLQNGISKIKARC